MKYRKKPVVIEAIQWTGLNLEEIKSFVGESLQYDIIDTAWEVGKGVPHVNMVIKTLEGDHICTKGDFIIKGVNGEFYPCKAEIFYKTYEAIDFDINILENCISTFENIETKINDKEEIVEKNIEKDIIFIIDEKVQQLAKEQVEEWMKYLEDNGVISGHVYGEYI